MLQKCNKGGASKKFAKKARHMELAYVRMVLDSCFYERIMNMKKLLATGLVASVAMSSAEAHEACVNGGFYVQGGFGLSTTSMKYKNDLKPQEHVLVKEEVDKMRIQKSSDGGAHFTDVYHATDINGPFSRQNVEKTSFNKRKNLFQFELGFGADKRLGNVMLGITCNFGKNFGNMKKKEKGMALTQYYNELLASVAATGLGDGSTQFRAGATQEAKAPYSNTPFPFNIATQVIDKANVDALKLYQRDLELEFKCKNKYYISIMPRFGILVNPRTELYVTAGIKIKSDKYTVTMVADKKSAKKTVTKCIPAVGLGLQYNFQNGVFVNLSYIFNFKAKKTFKFKANNKLNMDTTVKHTFQNSSKDVKFGIGYRF